MHDHPTYQSQVFDHLGLVAGMFDELGIGAVLDRATRHNPAMRDLTVGEAVKAMVLNGLGFIHQALYLVPRFFQNKPTSRLIALRVTPDQRNDDARGRALDTLYSYGVTALYSLRRRRPSAWALRPALPISRAPAFMSMGALTATRSPRTLSCLSPAGIAATIGQT